ncbi:MAG: protein translocase subunit SecD [Caldilineaceae bacterium SB0664_bin_27]|uniref:Protein translocase subunit SecD n=1 Tax=Caldilineaceae bacterium SB0664_bin_27 TaxID=2605260 RepID=A0A6B0YZT5_9CHLR|nr:protein translocase subunit SecD [Caldilineaceae bacterium SB0664_bin_27]
MRNQLAYLVLILFLFAGSLFVALPIDHPVWLEEGLAPGPDTQRDIRELTLGLDLKGGTQVLLEAEISEDQPLPEDALNSAKIIVEQRVNGLGLAEPTVQLQGESRMIVELPGVKNPDQAIETIRSTGQLEFVNLGGAPVRPDDFINTTNRPNAVAALQEAIGAGEAAPQSIPFPDEVFETIMTGDILQAVVATQDEFTFWQIQFDLKGESSGDFFTYTRDNIGEVLAIILDGRVLSTPVINAAINDNGVITGDFSQEEAESLAIQMRYGALPIPLEVVDVRTIGASLGQDSIDRSLQAGIVGGALVLLFMVLLYRLPGFLATMALAIYVTLNLATYKLLPVTLTLPGIAGFILSIGMAVDANILIFERMKEELRSGRSLRLAVETGFSRAWPAIRDGNLSTLISCAVLYWFGNNFGASVVKGFAITLSVGVLLSMFTAVFVTRTFMRGFLSSQGERLLSSRGLLGY